MFVSFKKLTTKKLTSWYNTYFPVYMTTDYKQLNTYFLYFTQYFEYQIFYDVYYNVIVYCVFNYFNELNTNAKKLNNAVSTNKVSSFTF
jgi:hypothetical protein